MKIFTVVFCLPALAWGSQSLQSGIGTASPLPKAAPWTNVSTWRAELRIHDFTFDGTYQQIFATASYALRLGPTNYALITSWADKSAACGTVSLAGRKDVILRLQRDAANSLLTIEAWNALDGSGYLQAQCPITTAGSPNDGGYFVYAGGFKGSLAYVRVYSTVVPLQTAPSNTFNGDLLDYELEGNGNDLAHGMNLKFDSAVYTATPTYTPGVAFGQYPASRTFQAGSGSITVDGSSTFTSTDKATLTYSWQQISGPSMGTFGNPTAPSTTFSAPLPGTYVLQLTATDNLGKTGSHQAKYGGVAVDANGYITTGDQRMDYILGPLTMWGTSPWPWFDLTERADADTLLPYVTTYPDAGVPLTGTVSLVSTNIYAPPTVTGTGTHFTTELKAGDGIAFAWLAPDGLTGQWRANVTSIADDAHLTLDTAGNPHPFPFIGITASKIDRSQYTYWGDNQNVGTNWNFYDDALALYRLYYRTGIDDYLTAARALADGWYHYALDHGYNIQAPYYTSLQGIMIRALDGHPEYWNGVMFQMNYPIGWNTQFSQTTPLPQGSQIEPRENGYMLRWGALVAKLHPDPAVRAQWCTNIVNSVTNVWPYVQDDLGNLEEDTYNQNPGYPYKAYQNRFGSSPWRGTLALLGFQQVYDVLNDQAACNNPDVANTALAVMTKFADFVHDYGTGSGRGQLYSVNYETLGQSPLAYSAFQDQSTPFTTGSLSVTSGSAIVTGTETNFTAIFSGVRGAVNGQAPKQAGAAISKPTKYIGIPAGAPCNLVFEVASVQSDAHLTLTEPWPTSCPTASGVTSSIGWVATWEGETNCFSLATYCEGGPTGDRNLTHDIHAAYLWTWQTTGIEKYYDWASDSLGADYGGPAGGPGTSGHGAGPLADGGTGNFSDPLPPCQTSAPPCGGYGPVLAMGKALGMSAGAGNATNAIAIYTVSQQAAAGQSATSARPIRNRKK